MKQAKASWKMDIYTTCPHCREDLDLTCDTPETYEEGWIYEVIRKNQETFRKVDDLQLDMQCPLCKNEFQLSELDYDN